MDKSMKKVLVIDAQGGGIGKQLIAEMKKAALEVEIIAVGTNSIATEQMLKAGADHAATGENPVLVNSRNVDMILGPVGIVIADSMYGEITPKMACAVGQSSAAKILIPINHCDNYIVGVPSTNVRAMIQEAVERIRDNACC